MSDYIITDVGKFLAYVKDIKTLSLDTETTGLMPYHGDKVFGISFSDGKDSWYYDASSYMPQSLKDFISDPTRTWYMANAKFDMHSIYTSFNTYVRGEVFDVLILARLAYNEHMSYSLGECAKRELGETKDDAVMDYIKEHKLWEWVEVPGKKVRKKKLFFDKVPQQMLIKYACKDARLTYKLAWVYIEEIARIDALFRPEDKVPLLATLALTEVALTKAIFQMEHTGVCIDTAYAQKCKESIEEDIHFANLSFINVTGEEYKASPKLFERIFESEKHKWEYTEKGNPSFESDVLKKFIHPAAEIILRIRDLKSRLDFFATFLYQADKDGFVHPGFNSGGTTTGRFSSSDPNFSNLTNDEESKDEKYSIRKAIIPPSGDYCIVSMDYKQQEYALMLDYAQETGLIEEVKNGADVHEATAKLMGVSRKYAKCIARGSLVLTNRGLVPIEKVTIEMLLWDGIEWVGHQGVISKGVKEVIEYDGFRATKEHKVFTECGRIVELERAKKEGLKLTKTEIKGVANWVPESLERRFGKERQRHLFFGWLLCLQSRVSNFFQQFFPGENYKLQMPKKQEIWPWKQGCEKPTKQVLSHGAALQQPKLFLLQELRWAGNTAKSKQRGLLKTLFEQVFRSRNFKYGDRQSGQQWPLRACESKIIFPEGKPTEHQEKQVFGVQGEEDKCGRFIPSFEKGLPEFCVDAKKNHETGLSGCEHREHSEQETSGDLQKEEVFDIVNAGPRNRFTCSGYLVKNCLNFALLYGSGAKNLAGMLGVSEDAAKELKRLYFSKLPKVEDFIKRVIDVTRTRGYIYNWAGRRFWCPDREFAYKFPNRIIQGGGADIMKKAMVRINSEILEKRGSRSTIALTVHDELVFYIHNEEISFIDDIKKIMEEVYPHKSLPMRVDISHSWENLGSLQDGPPVPKPLAGAPLPATPFMAKVVSQVVTQAFSKKPTPELDYDQKLLKAYGINPREMRKYMEIQEEVYGTLRAREIGQDEYKIIARCEPGVVKYNKHKLGID